MFLRKNKCRVYTLITALAIAFINIIPTIFGIIKANGELIKPQYLPCAEGVGECVMEVNSRRVLYANHADKRLPMASTTKIATAITVLENCADFEQAFTVPDAAIGVEGSSAYLQKGEKRTVKDLLYGLMLRSGNDCATALALHCSNSIARFSAKMNETAQKAGALNSRFENPHGLPCENHYTTAYDLSLITCYAMQNDTFREIVATKYYAPAKWKNKNKMLDMAEGGIGVKTGYTKQAGRCLVSAVERNGMTVVSTLLNCPTTYERSINLINDAFAHYQNVCLLKKTDEFLVFDEKTQVKCKANAEYYYPLMQEEKELISVKTVGIKKNASKQKSGAIVGQFQIYLSKRLLFSGNLYKL
jgi:D-alanyl-D-alanine carboxypeptidase (penicillin-binding protein 5/6)